MKSTLLRKLLLFVVLALLMNAVLVVGLFTYTSRNVFASMKEDELVPKAEFISGLVEQYQRGEISSQTLLRLLDIDKSRWDQSFWDASVHVFNEKQELILRTRVDEDNAIASHLMQYVPDILHGDIPSPLVASTAELGIVVGIAVYGVDAAITGAVFLTKPLVEVNAALSGLNTALFISSLLVLGVMVVLVYFGSRNFTNPMRQMMYAARSMAKGDFSIHADDTRRDEVGDLGRSLNELSGALSYTIGDLVLERNRLTNVLDGLREGIVSTDLNGTVTHCNPAAQRLLFAKTDPQAALEALRGLWPEIDAAFVAGTPESVVVATREATLKLSVLELRDKNDLRAGSVTAIQDVTEEVRLEQTRREYVANVSHELRTPIASIRSLAETLHDGMVKREDDKTRYYGYILRESMRLSRLINDLLELSRLQSGGVALEKIDFSLRPMMLEMQERFSRRAHDSGLTFALRLPETEMPAHANPDRVEQVLVSLLDNAVKYAQDNGEILLCVEEYTTQYRVSICSTGTIDSAHLPHLFERFYKADTAHTGEGTGLGLSIAREIMTLMEERIWAENESDRACFRFTLAKPANIEIPPAGN